jgi:tRNA(fMet)-specific endonuclease VapC
MKLLDTTVVIDIDRGGSEVLNKVRKLDRTGTHAISVVTQYEFYWGIFRRYQKGSKKYREAMEVDIMDTYIAATAILHRLTLVTANMAHFEEIDKLKVKKW